MEENDGKKKSDLINFLLDGDESKDAVNKITEKIIGSAYKVANELGCGFLEKVYENALAYELGKIGLDVTQQKEIDVFYDNVNVGHYDADLLVENLVLVELKTVKNLVNSHHAQCLNYLKATGLKICLLINFGNPRVEIKRLVL
jgi:GxxExxY protein